MVRNKNKEYSDQMTVIEFLDIWLLFLSCMYLISKIIEFIYIDFN